MEGSGGSGGEGVVTLTKYFLVILNFKRGIRKRLYGLLLFGAS